MRLKWVTTGLMIFGLGLLLGWPWIVGARPDVADKVATARYALRFGLYVIALMLVFASTAVCAWIIARRERRRFREEALANFKDLVEATLQDHGKDKS